MGHKLSVLQSQSSPPEMKKAAVPIPDEMWSQIFAFLPMSSFPSVMTTCHSFKRIIDDNNGLWLELFGEIEV